MLMSNYHKKGKSIKRNDLRIRSDVLQNELAFQLDTLKLLNC